MLGQESVFETQIYELHRLYQRQKDLMMDMEETQHLFPNAGVSSPRRSRHWMGSSISTSKTSVWPPEDPSAKIDEAGISGNEIGKSGEKVLDFELPSYGYRDIWEEEGSKNGEFLEVPYFPKDQSTRSRSLESVLQPESVQDLPDLSSFKCILDLNEPSSIEEHSDYELNQFPTPAQTRSERAERSPIESEQPRELVSASLHGKHGSEPSRSLVLALPCLETISLFHTRCSQPRKKAKRGAKYVKKNPRTKSRKGSNLDSNFGVNEDASYIPESAHNLEEVSSSSQPEFKRKCCKPQVEPDKVMRKSSRTKSKARGSFLVREEEEQEKSVAAADAIVDMSLSDSARKSSIKTSDCITPLHWFARIASSVVEDSKSEVGLSVPGFNSSNNDYPEAMTLQLTEMKSEEQRTNTPVYNFATPKHKRTSSYMVIDWGTVTKRRRGIRSPAC